MMIRLELLRADLVAAVRAGLAPEVLVVDDPGAVAPPCVFVDLPVVRLAGNLLEIATRVRVVGVVPGRGDGIGWMLTTASDLLEALGPGDLGPDTLSRGKDQLPTLTYVAVVRVPRTMCAGVLTLTTRSA